MPNPLACPECEYVRRPSDQTPLSQCPSCGLVFARLKAPTAKKSRGFLSAIARALFWATSLTGACIALFTYSVTFQALFMFTIAPTLLAAIDTVSSIPLGVASNGFFVPNHFGLWLSTGLLWSLIFFLFFLYAKPHQH